MMKKHKISPHQKKILKAMDAVYENLIAYKKKISEEITEWRSLPTIKSTETNTLKAFTNFLSTFAQLSLPAKRQNAIPGNAIGWFG